MTLAPKKRTRLRRNKKAVALLGIALPLGLSLYRWRCDKWFVKVKMTGRSNLSANVAMTLAPKKRTRLLRNKKAVALLGIALPLGLSLYIWRFDKWFVKVKMQSSIGIYTGDSPFKWRPAEGITNPVLTARDVTDVHAEIVADPFMVWENDTWYMFFEVVDQETKLGEIALATSSNGLKWRYKQVVLREPFTMSFP